MIDSMIQCKFISSFLIFANYEISNHPLHVIDAKLLE